MTPARVLLLPGWQNSGPGHWQSRWEALHGFERLERELRARHVATLAEALPWAPIHRQPLPFVTTAVLSADDPFGDAAHGLQLAAAWGSEIVSLGAAGHVNADSGLGDWPEGIALLQALANRAGLSLDATAG